jgi:hypothetical protein
VKIIFGLILAVLLIQAEKAIAADNQCQKAFGQNVASCQHLLINQTLSPTIRSDAHKACVDTATATRESCLSGTPACLDQCQISYDGANLSCHQTYDPLIQNCGLNQTCTDFYQGAENSCLTQAQLSGSICQYSCNQSVNTCVDNCQAQYDSNQLACLKNFDPIDCGGSLSCEETVLNNQTNCLSVASTTLNSCSATCPQ